MTSDAPASLTVSPAVADLGNRDDHGGLQGSRRREVRGRPRGAHRPGCGLAKAGRVLVDARGRTPHRPDPAAHAAGGGPPAATGATEGGAAPGRRVCRDGRGRQR
jgi:hypothetical protein